MTNRPIANQLAIFLFFLLAGFVYQNGFANEDATQPLYFRHFTKENGLPSEVVRWVIQDKTGYLWIGTDNGLVRYDGHIMKVFRHNPENPASLLENLVYSIFESSDSLLWIGTNNGFSVYNPATDFFDNYGPFRTNEKKFLPLAVHCFWEDTDGSLWIGTSNGLAHFNRENESFTWMLQTEFVIPSRQTRLSWIYQIDGHPGNENQIVIGTQGGILFIDKKSHSIALDLEKDVSHRSASQPLFFEGDSILWTGEWGTGLKKLDLNTLQWEIFTIPGENPLSPLFIERKSKDELWLATAGEGLVVFNTQTKKFTPHRKLESNPKSILSNSLQTNILIDKNGDLWVGGNEGLNFLDLSFRSFFKHSLPEGVEKIHCFFRGENEDKIFIGTDSPYNIIFKDLKTGKWGRIKDDEGVKPYAKITCIIRDHQGVIWATSRQNHLLYIDPNSNTLKLFRDKNQRVVLEGNSSPLLFQMVEDLTNNLWISAPFYGLIRINPSRENITYYKHDPNNPNSLFNTRHYTDLMIDPKNRLWIGSYDGFGVYEVEKGKFIQKFINCIDELGIRDQTFLGFSADSLGRFWACIPGKGLLRISEDEDQLSLKLFHTIHGLIDPNISRIVQDSKRNFWIINEGLLFFNPYTEQFNAFDKRNGLHGLKSHSDRIFIDFEDNIYLTGTQSYETQNALTLNVSKNIINLLIEEIEINGVHTIRIGTNKTSLNLKPFERNVKFHFTAICYQDPDRIQYEYQLIGYDNDVNVTTAPGTINYTNLPPGKYRFVVRAAHRGQWFEEEANLDFTLKPFFYQTAWFFLLALVLAILLVFGIIRLRVNRIRKQEKLKSEFEMKIAEIEMQSLRAQMNPHFIFNSLNSINTFILKNKTESASDYLNKFSRLIRAVLNNAKHKLVILEDELEALKIYMELEQLRFDNKFDFSIKTDNYLDNIRVYVPPLLLQPYVENAVWHGLLHKKTRGFISVTAERNEQHILFTIEDNGVGRKKAAEYKSTLRPQNKSVGMSLTADRIAIIKRLYSSDARIKVTDLYDSGQKPLGTRVTILLPLITKLN